jgi:hypothetical protein
MVLERARGELKSAGEREMKCKTICGQKQK